MTFKEAFDEWFDNHPSYKLWTADDFDGETEYNIWKTALKDAFEAGCNATGWRVLNEKEVEELLNEINPYPN